MSRFCRPGRTLYLDFKDLKEHMKQAKEKVYKIRVKRKMVTMTKSELKAKNVALVMEYKTADPDRRGEIFGEYFELNKSFMTYFPDFYGDYRQEIIATFMTMIPGAFMNFSPDKGVDVNSYLSMFYKKHAIRDFLYRNVTVHYNRFDKDEAGHTLVHKAIMTSLDTPTRRTDADGAMEWAGDSVVEYNNVVGATEAPSEYYGSFARWVSKFQGLPARILQDFALGYKWHEVMERSGLSQDRFCTTMVAVRLQLQRIIKEEGRDVQFISKAERSASTGRPRSRRANREVLGSDSGAGQDWGPIPDGESGFGDTFLRNEEAEDEATNGMEDEELGGGWWGGHSIQ